MPRPGHRVLLLSGDADHNIGDRAILFGLASVLVQERPDTSLAIVGDPFVNHALPAVTEIVRPGVRGAAALLAAAARADRVIVIGGGLLQDDDSRAKAPYWAVRLIAIRAVNRRIVGVSLGAGPLRHAESRLAARLACAAMQRVSARDRRARDALLACTAKPVEVVPDPAFLLKPATQDAARALIARSGLEPDRPLIVATVRRWYHARGGFVPNALKPALGLTVRRDDARFAAMLDEVASALATLSRQLGASILLLPGYNTEHEADDVACGALVRRLPPDLARIARVADPALYKAVIGRAKLVVSARMHPLIFAAGMGVPFVGLSYNPKFDGLYDLLGLAGRSLPLDRCPQGWGASSIVAAAELALAEGRDLRQRAEGLASCVRQEVLRAAFDDLPRSSLEAARAA